MDNVRAGAWALIVAAIAYIALMAVHPSHSGGQFIGALSLSAVVHGVAFLAKPVLLYGFIVMTRQMDDRPFAWIALCFYALASVMTMMAATMSAVVIPAIINAGHVHTGGHGPPIDPETLRQTLQGQANYTVILNRAFAAVHFTMGACAIVIWSIVWPVRSVLGVITRIFGVLSGGAVIAWALSGTMTLEARHGALLVTIAEMGWTLLAAATLLSYGANRAGRREA